MMGFTPHNALYVEEYCRLVGFFALSPDEQRALIPAVTEPVYAAFNEGDGIYTRPLVILLNGLRDAVSYVAIHHGEGGYSFVPESLNEVLSNKVYAIYYAQPGDNISDLFDAAKHDVFYDTATLHAPKWSALRSAARDVWNSLDEAYCLPLGDWRDFTG